MFEQKHVIDIFDKLAPDWDAQLIRSDEKIGGSWIMPASRKAALYWTWHAGPAFSSRIT